MKILVDSEKNANICIKFFTEDLKSAFRTSFLNYGTPLNPVPIDAFVASKVSGIDDITAGSKFDVYLDADNDLFSARLSYIYIQNLTPNYEGYMTTEEWGSYFDVEDKHIMVAPNGCIYAQPQENGHIVLQTKKVDDDHEILISYSIILSFELNNRICYCKIDPMARVTSGPK